MDVKLKPLGDRVLVKPIEKETQLPSGILLPETAKEKPQFGAVLAVGPGERTPEGKRIPLDVQPGQHVAYAKYAGTEIKLNGDTYLLLHEKDVLAVVEEE